MKLLYLDKDDIYYVVQKGCVVWDDYHDEDRELDCVTLTLVGGDDTTLLINTAEKLLTRLSQAFPTIIRWYTHKMSSSLLTQQVKRSVIHALKSPKVFNNAIVDITDEQIYCTASYLTLPFSSVHFDSLGIHSNIWLLLKPDEDLALEQVAQILRPYANHRHFSKAFGVLGTKFLTAKRCGIDNHIGLQFIGPSHYIETIIEIIKEIGVPEITYGELYE